MVLQNPEITNARDEGNWIYGLDVDIHFDFDDTDAEMD